MTRFELRILLLLFAFFSSPNGIAAPAASLYDLPVFSKWKGTPLVVTMTYTSCQFACPRILERMKNVQKFYTGKKRRAQFVVATFDPARDTAKKLHASQLAAGDVAKDWIFIGGSESEVRKISMVLGIRFEKNPESGEISHDNKIILTNERGEIVQELEGLSSDVSELR